MIEPTAIFWADPGPTTGMAWGVFDLRADTVKEAMRSREMSGSATFSIPGQWGIEEMRAHARAITDGYFDFRDECGMDVVLGLEHFVLIPKFHHKPGVEGIF